MARIRIVDEWLRSPVSPPSRYRAIMVVAESWGEQRVLMRAFQESADQTRPTIVLHGEELAVGPAGTDPHGPWGIHVQPPVDGRAQELRGQLELAAKRLAGSRGRPARLQDEAPSFDNKQTGYWSPGTPRDRHSQQYAPRPAYYEPAEVAPPSSSSAIPSAAPRPTPVEVPRARRPTPAPQAMRVTPVPSAPPRRRRGWTSPVPTAPAPEVGGRTALGFAKAPVTQPRPVAGPNASNAGLSKLVARTMPLGLQLSSVERDVLNALGEAPFLTASQVAQMAGVAGVDDALTWMDQLMSKLASHGIDLIAPGNDQNGEPTYVLRR